MGHLNFSLPLNCASTKTVLKKEWPSLSMAHVMHQLCWKKSGPHWVWPMWCINRHLGWMITGLCALLACWGSYKPCWALCNSRIHCQIKSIREHRICVDAKPQFKIIVWQWAWRGFLAAPHFVELHCMGRYPSCLFGSPNVLNLVHHFGPAGEDGYTLLHWQVCRHCLPRVKL
jgi:hypothetical protein